MPKLPSHGRRNGIDPADEQIEAEAQQLIFGQAPPILLDLNAVGDKIIARVLLSVLNLLPQIVDHSASTLDDLLHIMFVEQLMLPGHELHGSFPIGRASVRERVCQYGEISVGGVFLKKKTT